MLLECLLVGGILGFFFPRLGFLVVAIGALAKLQLL